MEALQGEARLRKSPNVRPRDAATLILLDHSGGAARVLLGRRHDGHKFMPGKFVFPGGRIEPCDRRMSIAGPLDAVVEEKLNARTRRPSSGFARALALAAIRETFEETGLALGVTDHGAPPEAPEGAWARFAATGVFPALDSLDFIARAITPSKAVRHAVFRRRRRADRPSHARRRQSRRRTRRTYLDAARGGREARHADHHARRPGGTGGRREDGNEPLSRAPVLSRAA
jgi:8-oxo-dGTP pyrophosphatase MutT (NUDIX family)